MGDKTFKIALLISLGIHSVVLAPWSEIETRLPKESKTNIEVTYFKMANVSNLKITENVKKIVPSQKIADTTKKEQIKKAAKTKTTKIVKKMPPKKTIASLKKPLPKRSIEMKSIPDLEGNISYMSYSQLIREKIRQRLYRNYSESMETGEVTIVFILRSSGALKTLKASKEYGMPNRRLRDLCIRSIKEAAPFSPFPKELDLDEISFRITISFKAD